MGGGNSKVGVEALTQLVREVLEAVFEARLGKIRCVECGNKRGCSPSRSVSLVVKRLKSQQKLEKGNAEGSGSGTNIVEHVSDVCPRSIRLRSALDNIETDFKVKFGSVMRWDQSAQQKCGRLRVGMIKDRTQVLMPLKLRGYCLFEYYITTKWIYINCKRSGR
ncbi:hypothetical protein GOBAR_AA01319 [Gossypium barbadense]|uniref:Uncharacterized protein n=1 Tax=Gossypium barbadense TaxID=3634 RepID=A0A2P5YUJ1_GOSBA|nr:hypothetical protein GOBAR_AA01319 [Gossypium barbadense]